MPIFGMIAAEWRVAGYVLAGLAVASLAGSDVFLAIVSLVNKPIKTCFALNRRLNLDDKAGDLFGGEDWLHGVNNSVSVLCSLIAARFFTA